MPDVRPEAVGGGIGRHGAGVKFHGGVAKDELNQENLEALEKGFANLERHLSNIQNHYGLPCVVSINHFTFDTDAEIELLKAKCEALGAKCVVAKHWPMAAPARKI